jgi:hypothetical protein
MWTMESSDHSVQNEADPRPTALDGVRTQRNEQRFDAAPFQSRGNWLRENCIKGLAVGSVHQLNDIGEFRLLQS